MKKFVFNITWTVALVSIGIPVLFFGFGGIAFALVSNLLFEDRTFWEYIVFCCFGEMAWLFLLILVVFK